MHERYAVSGHTVRAEPLGLWVGPGMGPGGRLQSMPNPWPNPGDPLETRLDIVSTLEHPRPPPIPHPHSARDFVRGAPSSFL